MAHDAESERKPGISNEIKNVRVLGTAVQAGSISGGVHIRQPETGPRTVVVRQYVTTRSRTRSPQLWLLSQLGVRGVAAMVAGEYVGAVVAGFIALVTGGVFASGSPWPVECVPLMFFGAGGGALFYLFVPRRLAPRLPRGLTPFLWAGAVTLPLALAMPYTPDSKVGAGLFMTGGLIGIGVYLVDRSRSRR